MTLPETYAGLAGSPAIAPSGVIVVTGGAGQGIGSGISRALAAVGWTVAIADRDISAARDVARDMRSDGMDAHAVEIDVSDEESVARAFSRAIPELGSLRGLVNNAGVGLVKKLAEVSVPEWDLLHAVDLRGAFLCSRAAIPDIIRNGGGGIVNIGSVQALGPHYGYSTYAAAKAGLIGLSRGIAADHGRDGIRCSIIHPGLVDSPQNREIFAAWGDPEEWIADYIGSRQMIPRLIRPDEVGAVAAFLLSDAGQSITATEIVIDGGSSRMAFDRTGDDE